VQAIMARMRRGPEQEPEFEKLNASLIALDYRDYPEEFAEMVGGPGYFFYVWDGLKRQFHANDDPIFLQAVLDYFHRELPRLSPPARYFHFIEFFAHMTNSPALVPPLIKGLESPDYRAAIASAASLAALPTTESARALLQAVKTAPYSDDLEINTRGTIALCIGRMRNAELIPMFEAELAVTKDELLRAQLKHAIAQSKR
jgi:HEAT repeat protein